MGENTTSGSHLRIVGAFAGIGSGVFQYNSTFSKHSPRPGLTKVFSVRFIHIYVPDYESELLGCGGTWVRWARKVGNRPGFGPQPAP